MTRFCLLILLFFPFISQTAAQKAVTQYVITLDQPGFPFIFELNQGESQTIIRSYRGKTIQRTISLNSIEPLTETNSWFNEEGVSKDYYQVNVNLNVSGTNKTLYHRPYQMPQEVNGLRIYIENVKEWDEHGKLGRTGNLKKQVRLAVCLENEPWGPESIVFPINRYRWRAAVYNNTWSGLVPFNLLYYHRGEDYGAIPDLLEVVSPMDGKIVTTPVPDGMKGSNSVVIENPEGLVFRFAHMNYETISKENTVGTHVQAGSFLGKTGMTWNGEKSQVNDPHLHVELSLKGIELSSFPFLMEAYQRKYPDEVFSIAGGYRFAVPGQKIVLDAGRSFSRSKSPLTYSWKLSNGKTVNAEVTSVTYNKPGIYCEELIVRTKEGKQDRDFLYVTVLDPEKKRNTAYGWAYFYPVRDLKPEDEVTFWNRIDGNKGAVTIDYGDGSPVEMISREAKHRYKTAGEYVTSITSKGPDAEPLTLKMEVIVE